MDTVQDGAVSPGKEEGGKRIASPVPATHPEGKQEEDVAMSEPAPVEPNQEAESAPEQQQQSEPASAPQPTTPPPPPTTTDVKLEDAPTVETAPPRPACPSTPPPPSVTDDLSEFATPPQPGTRDFRNLLRTAATTSNFMKSSVPPSPVVEPGALHELGDLSTPDRRRSSAVGGIAGLEELRNRMDEDMQIEQIDNKSGFDQLLQAAEIQGSEEPVPVIDAFLRLDFEDGNVYYVKHPSVVFGRAEGATTSFYTHVGPDGSTIIETGPRGFGMVTAPGTSSSKREKKKRKKKKKSENGVGPLMRKSKSTTSGASSSVAAASTAISDARRRSFGFQQPPQFSDPFGMEMLDEAAEEPLIHLPLTNSLEASGAPPRKNISRRHARLFYNARKKRFEFEVLGKNGAWVDDEFVGTGTNIVVEQKGLKVQIGGVPFRVIVPEVLGEGFEITPPEPTGRQGGGKMSFAFHDEHGNEVKTDPSEFAEDIGMMDVESLEESMDDSGDQSDEDDGEEAEDEDDGESDDDDSDDSDDDDIEASPSPEPVEQKKRGRGRPKKTDAEKSKKLKEEQERQKELERKHKLKEKERIENAKREKEKRKREEQKMREREAEKQKRRDIELQKQKEKDARQKEREVRRREKERERIEKDRKKLILPQGPEKKEQKLQLPSRATASKPCTPPAQPPPPPPPLQIPESQPVQQYQQVQPVRQQQQQQPQQPQISHGEQQPMAAQVQQMAPQVPAYQPPKVVYNTTPKTEAPKHHHLEALHHQPLQNQSSYYSSAIDPSLYETSSSTTPIVSYSTTPIQERPPQQLHHQQPQKKPKPPPKKRERSLSPETKESDYTIEQLQKPNLSYVVMCHEAILSSEEKALSLPQIYKAIERKYPYYKFKVQTNGWQSSVRHNLGQNKAFRKVERAGKGWLWGVVDGVSIEKEKKGSQIKPQFPPPGYGMNGQQMMQNNGLYTLGQLPPSYDNSHDYQHHQQYQQPIQPLPTPPQPPSYMSQAHIPHHPTPSHPNARALEAPIPPPTSTSATAEPKPEVKRLLDLLTKLVASTQAQAALNPQVRDSVLKVQSVMSQLQAGTLAASTAMGTINNLLAVIKQHSPPTPAPAPVANSIPPPSAAPIPAPTATTAAAASASPPVQTPQPTPQQQTVKQPVKAQGKLSSFQESIKHMSPEERAALTKRLLALKQKQAAGKAPASGSPAQKQPVTGGGGMKRPAEGQPDGVGMQAVQEVKKVKVDPQT